MDFEESSKAFEYARNVFPGGVNSTFQSFKFVGGMPIVVQSKKGACFTDLDGTSFIDYHNDFGASVLGYGNPEVLEAISIQLEKGFSTATPSEPELALAERIVESIPNIEKVRFTSCGIQACADSVQLARAFTKKNKIIVFDGSQHENLNVFSENDSNLFVCQYNHLESVADVFRHHSDEIAAVIVEPVSTNMGCILPENNFLENLKSLCQQHQSLLIFDETKTGFRLAFGGAQEVFNVEADLVVYGSVLGGGFPLGAFGARNEIMDLLSPKGDFNLANDPSSNILAFSAGLKTLEIIRNNPDFYTNLNKTSEILDFEIGKILNQKNIVHRINRKGSLMSVFFHVSNVPNFNEAKESNFALFNNFFHQLLQKGIYLPPNAFQSWFVSAAITQTEIEKTCEAVRQFEY